MVLAMWVKKDEDGGGGGRPSSSRSDSELAEAAAQGSDRRSRREMFETSRTAEAGQPAVTKSKSMSLKSQLKSPFKFLGKTYCGGCKVSPVTIMTASHDQKYDQISRGSHNTITRPAYFVTFMNNCSWGRSFLLVLISIFCKINC